MKLSDIVIFEEKSVLPTITLQQAHDQKLFGPVYHGSSEEGRASINAHGFMVIDDDSMRANGYQTSAYANGIPAPIHHLGYGVYFTTTKAIAKSFNNNSTKGLQAYYLNVPNIETINFAAPNTMMRWWQKNGYDFSWDNMQGEKNFQNPGVMQERIRATKNLTKELMLKYDAVWFKGKTIHKALDGDQICVYKPRDKIFLIDNSSVKEIGIGAKVKCKSVEIIRNLVQQHIDDLVARQIRTDKVEVRIDDRGDHYMVGNFLFVPKDPRITGVITQQHGDKYYTVKWKKGGTHYNYSKDMLEMA